LAARLKAMGIDLEAEWTIVVMFGKVIAIAFICWKKVADT
jgi:hypothetical protein